MELRSLILCFVSGTVLTLVVLVAAHSPPLLEAVALALGIECTAIYSKLTGVTPVTLWHRWGRAQGQPLDQSSAL